ncbi:hypothetical protein TREMEDRAFT_28951, partial [Tremella mesenterica DSM 1558]|uniref:uncharacterized protein n=1 Tax=Tremella mesenterica (strain ATCC 24925 / CBS 8224 / DSM 1558 / NBRC 9311 / NRRL Y-6157 / RJB 2259-6 / UBC 559-6) TaxID=578456 RepID=UPI0003F4A5CE
EIVHIVLWKLRQPIGPAKAAFEHLKSVPGAELMHLGPPLLDARAKGFDYGLYSIFSSHEALQKYAVSEAHVSCVEKHIKPNATEVMAYDFELEE